MNYSDEELRLMTEWSEANYANKTTKSNLTPPKAEITQRGFNLIRFKDAQGADCSLQKSSSAQESKIWLGTDDADPKVLVKHEGWCSVQMPSDVLYNTRMHLTREQVADLLPYLTNFVETGELLITPL